MINNIYSQHTAEYAQQAICNSYTLNCKRLFNTKKQHHIQNIKAQYVSEVRVVISKADKH